MIVEVEGGMVGMVGVVLVMVVMGEVIVGTETRMNGIGGGRGVMGVEVGGRGGVMRWSRLGGVIRGIGSADFFSLVFDQFDPV